MSKTDILDLKSKHIERINKTSSDFFNEKKELFPEMLNMYGYKPANTPIYKDRALTPVDDGGYWVNNSKVLLRSIFSKKSYEELSKEYKNLANLSNPQNRSAEGSFIGHMAIPTLITEVVIAEESIYSERLKEQYGPEIEKQFLLRNLPFIEEERQSSIELLSGTDSPQLPLLKATAVNNDEEILLQKLEDDRIETLTKTMLSSLYSDYKKAIETNSDTLRTPTVLDIKDSLNKIHQIKNTYFKHFNEMSDIEISYNNSLETEDFTLFIEGNKLFAPNKNQTIYNELINYTVAKNHIYKSQNMEDIRNEDIERYLTGQYKIYDKIYSTSKEMETLDTLSFEKNLELASQYIKTATNEELLKFSKQEGSAFISWNAEAMDLLENRKDIDIYAIKKNLMSNNIHLNHSIIDSYDSSIENINQAINQSEYKQEELEENNNLRAAHSYSKNIEMEL